MLSKGCSRGVSWGITGPLFCDCNNFVTDTFINILINLAIFIC